MIIIFKKIMVAVIFFQMAENKKSHACRNLMAEFGGDSEEQPESVEELNAAEENEKVCILCL